MSEMATGLQEIWACVAGNVCLLEWEGVLVIFYSFFWRHNFILMCLFVNYH